MADGSVQIPGQIGQPHLRIEAALKVTGAARYPADMPAANMVHAYLVVSAIAKGEIKGFDLKAARAVPGVIDILTWEDLKGEIKPVGMFGSGGPSSTTIFPMQGPKVQHDGEIVAIVLAERFEQAREAAYKVKVDYAAEAPSAEIGSPGVTQVAAKDVSKDYEDPEVGDAQAAFAAAPVKIEARYSTPPQHHNAMELFSTTCAWSGEKLTIQEPSQFVYGLKNGVAQELGIDPANVRALSTYTGGAFGSKGSVTPRTALIAIAAKRLGRPVRLVASRAQGFSITTYRAETRHHLKLAADRDGKLVALTHEGWELSSRPDDYKVAGTDATTRMYACPNVASKVTIVHADRNTPGFMRAPAEVPYMFALESGMDELAVALKMDPVELRRINDTKIEPIKGLPYTSRTLMPCFDQAAAAFGWSRRNPEPRSMREGDWLIGWGCATTCYPTQVAPATARVRLTPEGKALVQTAAHDVGTGTYTVLAQVAAERLGLPVEAVEVRMADSDLPPAPVSGGSNVTASVCNVVAKACGDILARVAGAATATPEGPFSNQDPGKLKFENGQLAGPGGRSEPLKAAVSRLGGVVEAYAENTPHGAPENGVQQLYKGVPALAGGAKMKDRIQFAFGAEFVEVRVHALTGEVRCPRVVGAFAAGRIVNPITARSQLMGGLIWGVSSALHEATEVDPRAARYVNDNLADYLIPVNADIGEVEVIFVPEEDPLVNDLGVKGIGELGGVGTNAAVANAVWHATGKRIRDLPIRLENLI